MAVEFSLNMLAQRWIINGGKSLKRLRPVNYARVHQCCHSLHAHRSEISALGTWIFWIPILEKWNKPKVRNGNKPPVGDGLG